MQLITILWHLRPYRASRLLLHPYPRRSENPCFWYANTDLLALAFLLWAFHSLYTWLSIVPCCLHQLRCLCILDIRICWLPLRYEISRSLLESKPFLSLLCSTCLCMFPPSSVPCWFFASQELSNWNLLTRNSPGYWSWLEGNLLLLQKSELQ